MRKHKVEKDIHGNYTNKAIGYCHCTLHKGAITEEIAKKHHCKAKSCHNCEKYNSHYWDTGKKRRKFSKKNNKDWRKFNRELYKAHLERL